MLINFLEHSFAGGEVSGAVYPRTDIEKYKSSLRTARNFIIHPHGGASNRPGSQFIARAKYSASTCVSSEFIFSNDQAYVLEFGHYYVRFYTDGAQIQSNATPYEVSTPYPSSDVSDLRFESSADVIFITHPDYQTMTLTRYGNASWVLEEYAPEDGPFMPENIDESSSLTVSAVTGTGVTLSLSASPDTNTKSLIHANGTNGSQIFTDDSGKTVTAIRRARISTAQSKFGGASALFNTEMDTYTKLLIPMNGASASTAFYDVATGKTVTTNGDAKISTAAIKFGGSSGLFDGTGDYLTLADSADWFFGTDDFTIDLWVNFTSVGAAEQVIAGQWQDDSNRWDLRYQGTGNNTLAFVAKTAAAFDISVTCPFTPTPGVWYHIMLARDGSTEATWHMFIDGVEKTKTLALGAYTATLSNNSGLLYVGRRGDGALEYSGYMSELRISKGIARQTSDFTAPTVAYSVGDYLSLEDSADWNFGTGNFTIDFWMYASDLSESYCLSAQYASATSRMYLIVNTDGSLRFRATNTTEKADYTSSAGAITVGSWKHVEVVRSGTNFYIFVNGVSLALTTATAISTNDLGNISSTFDIGGSLLIGIAYFHGYIDEFRVSNTARHTAGFTPSTSEYTIAESLADFIFSPLHVGGLFKLVHYVEGQIVSQAFSSATTSASIKCFTTWRIITHGTWTGKLKIQKSIDGGTTWTTLRAFSSTDDFNANTSGTEDIETNEQPFLIRINMYSYTSGTCNVDLTSDPFYQEGIVRVASFVSPISVTADVLQEVGYSTATSSWSEGSWSDYRGYPAHARFYQDKFTFANTYSEPNTFWMTETGNYYSFVKHSPLLNSDSISSPLPSRQLNAINGLLSFKKLLAFTSSAVWSIGPTSTNGLTPTTTQIDVEEYSGSSDVAQVAIGKEAIYNQFGGEIISNIGYQLADDGFTGTHINILAKHLFEGYTITKMAYQKNPNGILWCLRSDGVLLGVTYLKEQEIVAWTKHDTTGTVMSMCVIPKDGDDELWLVVERTNGIFIEKMSGRKQFEIDDLAFMDSYTLVSSSTETVSALSHLANQVVAMVGDGEDLGTQTVSAGGTLALSANYDSLYIGLPYESDLETLDIEIPLKDGTLQGSKVKIGNVTFRVLNTRGGYIGPDVNNLKEAFTYEALKKANGGTLGETENFSGDIRLPLGSGYTKGGRVFYRQTAPLPVTIGAIISEIEVGGKGG